MPERGLATALSGEADVGLPSGDQAESAHARIANAPWYLECTASNADGHGSVPSRPVSRGAPAAAGAVPLASWRGRMVAALRRDAIATAVLLITRGRARSEEYRARVVPAVDAEAGNAGNTAGSDQRQAGGQRIAIRGVRDPHRGPAASHWGSLLSMEFSCPRLGMAW